MAFTQQKPTQHLPMASLLLLVLCSGMATSQDETASDDQRTTIGESVTTVVQAVTEATSAVTQATPAVTGSTPAAAHQISDEPAINVHLCPTLFNLTYVDSSSNLDNATLFVVCPILQDHAPTNFTRLFLRCSWSDNTTLRGAITRHGEFCANCFRNGTGPYAGCGLAAGLTASSAITFLAAIVAAIMFSATHWL